MQLAFYYILLMLIGGCIWQSSAAASEKPIAVVVTPGFVKNLKDYDLVRVFKRKKLFWADGTKVQPTNLPISHPLRRAFSQAVLGQTPEALESYWNDLYFHGTAPPYVLGSEEAVLRFVSEVPGAIGYVSYCQVDNRVEVVFVITASGKISRDIALFDCPG